MSLIRKVLSRNGSRSVSGGAPFLMGGLLGLSVFTFWFAEGTSYLSDDPAACINCHVMRDQFEDWQHASHREVATCNGCHTPHKPLAKWTVKAIHGWNHSVAFTSGRFEEPIRIKSLSARVVQQNCIDCHAVLVESLFHEHTASMPECASCHEEVGH